MSGIPLHGLSGALPPYVGTTPIVPASGSPYWTTSLELVQRYAVSGRRRAILKGFLDLRAELRAWSINDGFQWVDGGFVDNIPGVEPRDIDVVTFFTPPETMRDPAILGFVFDSVPDVFDSQRAKARYSCDAYYVTLGTGDDPGLVDASRYWYSLFAHKRVTQEWRGFLRLPLGEESTDLMARATLLGGA